MFSNFFIDRPIFATVLSIVIVILGGGRLPPVADCPIPGGRASRGPGVRDLSRRQRQDRGRDRGHAHRTGSQRRRADALHVVALHQRRPDVPRRHLRGGHEPRHGAGAGAEPRLHRGSQAAGGSQAARRDHEEEIAGDPAVRQFDFARRELRPALPEQFRVDEHQGRPGPSQGGRRRGLPRPARLQHAGLARPEQAGGARHDGRRGGQGHQGAERPGRRGPHRPVSGARRRERAFPAYDQYAGPHGERRRTSARSS